MRGKLFYIMGKSASGKDHIYEALQKDATLKDLLWPVILYTTRPMRDGECEGREYFFIDEEKLEALRAAGKVIEERCYQTVYGPWYYFTADDGQLDLAAHSYLGIGTLESYVKLKDYFDAGVVVPIYIETEDGLRLVRALQRERKQNPPKYAEMCRRFLGDCEDFSEEKILAAGISRRFYNNGALEDCVHEVADFIHSMIE